MIKSLNINPIEPIWTIGQGSLNWQKSRTRWHYWVTVLRCTVLHLVLSTDSCEVFRNQWCTPKISSLFLASSRTVITSATSGLLNDQLGQQCVVQQTSGPKPANKPNIVQLYIRVIIAMKNINKLLNMWCSVVWKKVDSAYPISSHLIPSYSFIQSYAISSHLILSHLKSIHFNSFNRLNIMYADLPPDADLLRAIGQDGF